MPRTSHAPSAQFGPRYRPAYRVILLAKDGAVALAAYLAAGSDPEAIESAAAIVDDHTVELWDRHRLVERLPPTQ